MHNEPFWWTKDWTKEEKQLAGDPRNRINHMHRTVESVDAFERRIDLAVQTEDDVFGPVVIV